MKKLLFSLTFAGAAAFGQVELMSNNWPTDPQGHPFFPDAQVTFDIRTTGNITGLPKPGIPYSFTVTQYKGWGYHTHESDPLYLGAPIRPMPIWLNGTETGVTDAAGHAIALLELNYFAGAYTICAYFKNPQNPNEVINTKCVNNITRYYTAVLNVDLPLERYQGGLNPLTPNEVNQPQSRHYDGRHVCSNGVCPVGGYEAPYKNNDGYTTRWGTHATVLALYAASGRFKDLSFQNPINQGDMLDVTRMSLPDGGIYDNDTYGVTPSPNSLYRDWTTRTQEEHSHGNEADIVQPDTAAKRDLMYDSLHKYFCVEGAFTPDGVPVIFAGRRAYWDAQDVVHVSCSRAPQTKIATQPRPR